MCYQLSATKLQTYHHCPQAYYFRYELGIKTATTFAQAALGTALHQTLAQIYGKWHYLAPLPSFDWFTHCWIRHSDGLSPAQVQSGKAILQNYYQQFVAPLPTLQRPLGVEGKILGHLQMEDLEFTFVGRYDRLDYCEDGLELIDYKSSHKINLPSEDTVDLQLGLYYLGLEQRYGQRLHKMSLLYLRQGKSLVTQRAMNTRNW